MVKKRPMSINVSYAKGTILIVALFIITLIEIIIVGLATYHRVSVHHSKNFYDALEATNLCLAGEDWARMRIIKSFKNNENMTQDTLSNLTLKNGTINGQVTDAQGQLNINNLINANMQDGFKNFLTNVLGANEKTESFVSIIQNQVNDFENHQAADLSLVPFSSITELRTLPGMNQELFLKLSPHISALPEVTALNINSATNYSLLSLSPKITLDTAKAIISIRDNMHGFSSVDTFFALEPLAEIEASPDAVTVQSQYFISTMTVHYQAIDLTLNSLIKVNKRDNGIDTMVIWRSFGTL
ncbi:MAG: type II secretion system minor pseudopilin GspK [Proteobacteria bacterium]|nr:type II secretion system minor pseudopilin GspK [Pseudomonadota bacterium]